jgi:hypothetical protein
MEVILSLKQEQTPLDRAIRREAIEDVGRQVADLEAYREGSAPKSSRRATSNDGEGRMDLPGARSPRERIARLLKRQALVERFAMRHSPLANRSIVLSSSNLLARALDKPLARCYNIAPRATTHLIAPRSGHLSTERARGLHL